MTGARQNLGSASPSPRAPSSTLVVDANIVLSATLGYRSRPVFERVTARRAVVISARAADEVRGVLGVRNVPGGAMERADALLAGLFVAEPETYAGFEAAAGQVLERAVASRNGSMRDAHLLACAWAFNADLWTHDRDFAGAGWPSWSNANLSESLRSEPA